MSFDGYMAAPPTMTVFSFAAMPAAARTDNAAHMVMSLRNIVPSCGYASFCSDYGPALKSDCAAVLPVRCCVDAENAALSGGDRVDIVDLRHRNRRTSSFKFTAAIKRSSEGLERSILSSDWQADGN
jgi:hypothetical protein